jgi:autonomous glycyl radical cofactor GrcA
LEMRKNYEAKIKNLMNSINLLKSEKNAHRLLTALQRARQS